jgi:hypothetical protein
MRADAGTDERTEEPQTSLALEEIHEGNNAHMDDTQIAQAQEGHADTEVVSVGRGESSNVHSTSREEGAEEKPLPLPSSPGAGPTSTEFPVQLIDDRHSSVHDGVNSQTLEPVVPTEKETQSLSEEPRSAVELASEDSVSSEHDVPTREDAKVLYKEDEGLPPPPVLPRQNRPQKPVVTLVATTSSELVPERPEPVEDQSTPISPVKGKEKSHMSFKKVQMSLLHRKSKEAVAPKEKEPILRPKQENENPKPSPIVNPDPIARDSATVAASSSPSVPKEFVSSPSQMQPLKPVGSMVAPQGVQMDTVTPAEETLTKPEATTVVSPQEIMPKPPAKKESPTSHKTRHQSTTRPNAAFDSPISKNISPLFPSLSLFSSTSYGQQMKAAVPKNVAPSASGRSSKTVKANVSRTEVAKVQNRTPEASTQPVVDRIVAPQTTAVDNSESLGFDSTVADMVALINFDDLGSSQEIKPAK